MNWANFKKILNMKSIFTILMLFSTLFLYSQKSDTTIESKKSLPYYIELLNDKMTDENYAFGSKSLLCSDDGKKGFIVKVSWNNNNGQISYGGLSIVSAGIGGCVENDNLFFLFDDESKFNMKSWNDFNCKGDSYFDLYRKYMDDFTSKKVIAIRFQNGNTFDSFTYNLTKNEQTFFLEAKEALKNQRFVNLNKKL
jgi:hypothetical protein